MTRVGDVAADGAASAADHTANAARIAGGQVAPVASAGVDYATDGSHMAFEGVRFV
jgi:hypothetical protein